MVLPSALPGRMLAANAPLRLRFSDPGREDAGKQTAGARSPHSRAAPAKRTDAHTLEFGAQRLRIRPRLARAKLKLPVPVTVAVGGSRHPTRTLAWTTPEASELRLEQLLALLRYLPLQWQADVADAPRTTAGQSAAAVDPPRGRFTWRYSNIPPELARLRQPGTYNVIVRGAIMAFQSEGRPDRRRCSPARTSGGELIADVIAGKPRDTGYSYVYVHSSRPRSR